MSDTAEAILTDAVSMLNRLALADEIARAAVLRAQDPDSIINATVGGSRWAHLNFGGRWAECVGYARGFLAARQDAKFARDVRDWNAANAITGSLLGRQERGP